VSLAVSLVNYLEGGSVSMSIDVGAFDLKMEQEVFPSRYSHKSPKFLKRIYVQLYQKLPVN